MPRPPRTPFRHPTRHGVAYCRTCGAYRPDGEFHPSSLRRRLRQCRACVCRRVREQSRACTVQAEIKLLRNLRRWVRRHKRPREEAERVGRLRARADVCGIVRRWGGHATVGDIRLDAEADQSAHPSRRRRHEAAILVPWRPEEEFNANTNHAILGRRDADTHSRLDTREKREAVYGREAVERAERVLRDT